MKYLQPVRCHHMMLKLLSDVLEKEHQIIYVSISARGSGINNTANMVAEQLKKEEGFDITVIDSGMFAMAGIPCY